MTDRRCLCLWSMTLLGGIIPAPGAVAADRSALWTDAKVSAIVPLVQQMMQEQGIPGLSIAVATENQLRFEQSFGLADVENQVPVLSTTRFRTASIAKSLTATLIMKLAELGKLDLDAEVQKYCPDFPTKKWPVTTRQLLGHLGGVRHYKNAAESSATDHFFSLPSALKVFANDPLLHEPGTKFQYTSFGYNLLGSVAEGAGGEPFTTLLQQHLLQPASMTHTVADDHFTIIPGRARGYMRGKLPPLQRGELYNSTLHDTSMKIPGGGLLSTASDLVRFATAVNTGKIVGDASKIAMWTRQRLTNGSESQYGLGWRVDSPRGRLTVSHTGGQSGTSTVLLLDPAAGVSVAMMCNLQNAKLVPTAQQIAGMFLPQAPTVNYLPVINALQSAIRYEVDQKKLPALSLALVDHDRVVWADGFGHQDARLRVPATANTVYRVGSISKLFTDIAVMQLVEAGKLDLDAPITRYFPDFQPINPFGVPITLRQLMTHRSGLVRESPIGHYFDPAGPSLAATVASLNPTTLVYKPDAKTKYSNAGVAVVGAVLEKVLGSTHPQRVREQLLDPLGMTTSDFEATPRLQEHLATGWMWTYDNRRFEAPTFLLGTGPAGNLYASVLDLAKFATCVFNDGRYAGGQILKPETLRLMLTPTEAADGKPTGFGLGFHVQNLDGWTKVGHGGAVYGFSTQLELLPERKLGVIAAASLDGTNGVVGRLADHALRLALAAQDGKPLPAYEMTTPLPTERIADLVGEYQDPASKQHARISAMGPKVHLHRGVFRQSLRAGKLQGEAITDDVFQFGTNVTLTAKDQIRIGDAVYHRLPDVPPTDIPDRWRGLIGEYGWDHNTLYILEDHGQLHALIEWFYLYPLSEVSPNEFRFPAEGLYHGEGLIFQRDADGQATAVTAASVKFDRRQVGTAEGQTFKITPVKAIDELRADAKQATPPTEAGEFRNADLTEVVRLDPTIKLDIRYATTNNFMGETFYTQPRAFLQRPAAEALARVHQRLAERGLGIMIHDAYRPWQVTKMFWDATPTAFKHFVANPAKGSRHNRGCAVDLTLFDRAAGAPITMAAGYDEFSNRSFPLYPGGTARQRYFRDFLRRAMEAEGFAVYEFEWWHFDYKDWQRYRIGVLPFEELDPR